MPKAKDPLVNVHLVFYRDERDEELLDKLNAEVARRKRAGDTKFSRTDLIKELIEEAIRKNDS